MAFPSKDDTPYQAVSVHDHLADYFSKKQLPWRKFDSLLFWNTIQDAAKQCFRNPKDEEKEQYSALFSDGGGKKKNMPARHTHNFLRFYERNIRQRQADFATKLQQCQSLKTSNETYYCNKPRVCPFCYYRTIVRPFYFQLNKLFQERDKSQDWYFVSLSIPLTESREITPAQISSGHTKLLKYKKKFQDKSTVRQIKHKWFRSSLQGKDEDNMQVYLDMLCLVTLDQYKKLKKFTDKQSSFGKQWKLRKTKATVRTLCSRIGHFFRYPYWMLKTPVETIEQYLATPIYRMRSKVTLPEKRKQARREYQERRKQRKSDPLEGITGPQREYFESLLDMEDDSKYSSWWQMDLEVAQYDAQAKRAASHVQYIRGPAEDLKGHLQDLRDYCRHWSDLLFNDAFRSEEACRVYLVKRKWPRGFRCPKCGKRICRRLENNQYHCIGCRTRTSAAAGTLFHKTRVPLTLWFRAIRLVLSRENRMTILEFQKELGIDRYETARILWRKIYDCLDQQQDKITKNKYPFDRFIRFACAAVCQ